jgi:hypothetical protein
MLLTLIIIISTLALLTVGYLVWSRHFVQRAQAPGRHRPAARVPQETTAGRPVQAA